MTRPMSPAEAELLPCPFCGGSNIDNGMFYDATLMVECRDCAAGVPGGTRSAAVQAWNRRASRSPLAAPVAEGWRDMASAPKDGTHVLLNLGETIPDLVDARVGQFITEKEAAELGETVSASGGWIIWDTGGDWFVVPYADVFGWAPLPAAPGTHPAPASPDAEMVEVLCLARNEIQMARDTDTKAYVLNRIDALLSKHGGDRS